jgi:uncharacterized damage-inducible protein DinB
MNAEQAKFLADYFAGLIEQETATTARVLAAVPDDKRDYKPDPKSRTAWELTTHLATGDVWFLQSILDGKFVMDPAAADRMEKQFTTVADVVAFYNREMPVRLKALRGMSADKLAQVVDFFGMMQQPNAAYLGIATNHGVHHRGQLASYLRAMGSKVPSIYGGSADEPLGS